MKVSYTMTAGGLIQGEISTSGGPLSDFQLTPAHRLVILVDGLNHQEVARVLRSIATVVEKASQGDG